MGTGLERRCGSGVLPTAEGRYRRRGSLLRHRWARRRGQGRRAASFRQSLGRSLLPILGAEGLTLGLEPEPDEQVLEPGIRAKRSESWIHLEIVQPGSLLVGLFQILERLVAVTQRKMDQRDVHFQAGAPLETLRQLGQQSFGVRSLAGQ